MLNKEVTVDKIVDVGELMERQEKLNGFISLVMLMLLVVISWSTK